MSDWTKKESTLEWEFAIKHSVISDCWIYFMADPIVEEDSPLVVEMIDYEGKRYYIACSASCGWSTFSELFKEQKGVHTLESAQVAAKLLYMR